MIQFRSTVEDVPSQKTQRYQIFDGDRAISYQQFVVALREETEFRRSMTDLLCQSSFAAFRWETPAVSKSSVHLPFEFVLLEAGWFASRKTDSKTYKKYFTRDETDQGVVTFSNLSGDATLIVPSPRTAKSFLRANDFAAYGHFAAFLRQAPANQVDALWKVMGQTLVERIHHKPLWLSTAGGGVAWLHVRIDRRPKYYGYAAYRKERTSDVSS